MRQAPVCVAPVLQDEAVLSEDALPDVEIPAQVPEVQDDLKPEVGASEVDAARSPRLPGIKYWSPAEVLRKGRRLLHAPVYGTKEQPRKLLLEFRDVIRKEAALQRELAAERDARRQALSENKRWTPTRLLTFRQNRGANIVRWERETGASSKLPASGPWAGRQFDPNGVRAKGGMVNRISRGECENGLVVSHLDAEQRCCWSSRNNSPAFPSGYMMQVFLPFLKRLCLETRDCTDGRRNNETRMDQRAGKSQTKADTYQNDTCSF